MALPDPLMPFLLFPFHQLINPSLLIQLQPFTRSSFVNSSINVSSISNASTYSNSKAATPSSAFS
jgi:hypothetical protein